MKSFNWDVEDATFISTLISNSVAIGRITSIMNIATSLTNAGNLSLEVAVIRGVTAGVQVAVLTADIEDILDLIAVHAVEVLFGEVLIRLITAVKGVHLSLEVIYVIIAAILCLLELIERLM